MDVLTGLAHKALSHYLQNYAHPIAQQAIEISGHWRRVSILPVYKERPHCLSTLSIPNAESHCCVVIANRPDCDTDIRWLSPWYDALGVRPDSHMQLIRNTAAGDVLWLNFASEQSLADKAGVGLARKIASDVACRLIAQGQVDSPWIHSLDADAQLPSNYFEHCDADDAAELSSAAISFPFKHIGDIEDNTHQATLIYEWHLYRYALGLLRSGSDYAWVPLGSAMAFRAIEYAQVRGFPQRSGGEDFYLLNKLAKIKPIRCAQGAAIRIQSRSSDRVPFGTGPSTSDIQRHRDPWQWSSRSAYCFAALKGHRKALFTSLKTATRHADISEKDWNAVQRALHCSPQAHRQQQHLRQWLDGFRELKYIHSQRDTRYPDKTVAELSSGEQGVGVDLTECHLNHRNWSQLIASIDRMRDQIYNHQQRGPNVY